MKTMDKLSMIFVVCFGSVNSSSLLERNRHGARAEAVRPNNRKLGTTKWILIAILMYL